MTEFPPHALSAKVTPMPMTASAPKRRVFVRGLTLPARIGAYAEEMGREQPVIVDIEMEVCEPADPASDALSDVVCYDRLSQGVKAILAEGHIKLVETLAERIAAMCLVHPMAIAVRVRVEKPGAIREAAGAGVEVVRAKGG